jgi:hypothetical protein
MRQQQQQNPQQEQQLVNPSNNGKKVHAGGKMRAKTAGGKAKQTTPQRSISGPNISLTDANSIGTKMSKYRKTDPNTGFRVKLLGSSRSVGQSASQPASHITEHNTT